MYEFTEADLIWNRACGCDAATLSPGDRALEAMLAFHGQAMNGGVLDALEYFGSDRLEDAEAGYRYFGLEGVADLLNEAKSTSKADDDLDLWEAELDRRYSAIVPNDSTLVARFEMIFRRSPSEFAPI
jgi:hypothetical protein